MANVVSDLFAPSVWHVGCFLVATTLHGSGLSHGIYFRLESWMREQGAEVRRASGVAYGKRTHTLSVRFKPLAGGTIEQYRELVPRDARASK